MSVVTTQQIPITEFDLLVHEQGARQLLPHPMRVPVQVTVVSPPSTNLALTGIYSVDGVAGFDGMGVLVRDNTDKTQNGPYLMRAGAWQRMTDAPSQSVVVGQLQIAPTKPIMGQFLTFQVSAGQGKGQYYWVTTPDIITVGVTPITIEVLGDSLFSWHFGRAEKEIATDLDKRHQPIYFRFLQDLSVLTDAKVYKTLHLLYLQSTAGNADVSSDRHARLAREYLKMYENEIAHTMLRLIDGGRVRGKQRRVIRG